MNDLLKMRGIDHAAILMQWDEQVNGWKYPVYDYKTGETLGYRFKSKPGQTRKYFWSGGKPDDANCELYLKPSFLDSALRPQHIPYIYLVNGEPALLSLYQAHIFNAFTTTLSEGAIPTNALEFLQHYNIQRVIHILDKDPQGIKDGVNWRNFLQHTHIDYTPLILPDNLDDKSDVNDLWQYLNFDIDAMKQHILKLRPANLPQIVQKQSKQESIQPTQKAPKTPQKQVIFDDPVPHILSALNASYRDANGRGFVEISCPFTENHKHGDKNKSAAVSVDTGIVHCMVCGTHYTPTVCQRLGIQTSYTIKRSRQVDKNKLIVRIKQTITDAIHNHTIFNPKHVEISELNMLLNEVKHNTPCENHEKRLELIENKLKE